MTKKEREKILNAAREFAKKAKQVGKNDIKLTMKYGETSSLGEAIKTQEQADFFMKMLKALQME